MTHKTTNRIIDRMIIISYNGIGIISIYLLETGTRVKVPTIEASFDIGKVRNGSTPAPFIMAQAITIVIK